MNLSSRCVLALACCLARYAIMRDRLGRLFDGTLLAVHSVGLYAVIANGLARGTWRSGGDGCVTYTLGAAGLANCIVRRVVILVRLHAAEHGSA
jgi:hypothetical protein